jgi:hypothetical protein
MMGPIIRLKTDLSSVCGTHDTTHHHSNRFVSILLRTNATLVDSLNLHRANAQSVECVCSEGYE